MNALRKAEQVSACQGTSWTLKQSLAGTGLGRVIARRLSEICTVPFRNITCMRKSSWSKGGDYSRSIQASLNLIHYSYFM